MKEVGGGTEDTIMIDSIDEGAQKLCFSTMLSLICGTPRTFYDKNEMISARTASVFCNFLVSCSSCVIMADLVQWFPEEG